MRHVVFGVQKVSPDPTRIIFCKLTKEDDDIIKALNIFFFLEKKNDDRETLNICVEQWIE